MQQVTANQSLFTSSVPMPLCSSLGPPPEQKPPARADVGPAPWLASEGDARVPHGAHLLLDFLTEET